MGGMVSVKDILDLMNSPSREDRELIEGAYKFSKEAHEGQKRYSGDPYFIHPAKTAQSLAELGMGPKTVAAGLLHDTLEDVDDISAKKIKEEFGEEVLFLVQGVTKLGHVRYKGATRHIESLRKLFVATSQDIRVLIIKLADRLHNMETLKYIPEEKQKRIAQETMEVYAPIAHRLRMGKMTGVLEDLAFPYIKPEEYKKTHALSKNRYKESEVRLDKVYRRLKKELAENGFKDVKTDYRKKHLYSLWRKLKRKEMDIDRVYDILALRIIVPTIHDCYRVLGIIHSIWRPLPGRIKDYIAFPKPNGYQSIHTTIFTGDGGLAEIQIRTEKMHREAEYGIAPHVQHKRKGVKLLPLEWFKDLIPGLSPESEAEVGKEEEVPNWIKDLAEAQSEIDKPRELLNHLKTDYFENRIFVFTPKGDVIDLPAGSSPIDFAYQIHTDIGDHVSGAKVNSKLVSLDTTLSNGDIVEIETRKKSKPSQKWLNYAKTSFARRKIRSALQKK
ncbi:MAG: RelA/SpoT family protein [Candidatus Paceibacterota bacterium]